MGLYFPLFCLFFIEIPVTMYRLIFQAFIFKWKYLFHALYYKLKREGCSDELFICGTNKKF